jgi:pyruvate dehydrogenase E2 component (dihydrolipoamide acetyltransferase)
MKQQPIEERAPSPIAAGPDARRLAQELGVNLSQVQGSGKRGRITVEDVRTAAAKPAPAANAAASSATPSQTSTAGVPAQPGTREPAIPPGELGQDAFGPVRREPLSSLRRAMAAQMVESAKTIPQITLFDDADVTELERMRKSIPPAYLGPTVKLTTLPFVMKAIAMALRQHPALNGTLDETKQELVYKQYINLGLAIDTPHGPVVPVLRNVDQMGVLQIARELTLLASRARSADFKTDELCGGTFTISNLGAGAGTYSTPMVQPTEVATVLLGRARWLLGVHEGKVEGRLMLPLSLSYDSRVIDGTASGQFLNAVIDFLQAPGKLLLTK